MNYLQTQRRKMPPIAICTLIITNKCRIEMVSNKLMECVCVGGGVNCRFNGYPTSPSAYAVAHFFLLISCSVRMMNLILINHHSKRVNYEKYYDKARQDKTRFILSRRDLHIPSASKDSFKKSFFPQTIRDWNALPDSLICSVELSDDCVSKFTSLVRARDLSSSAKPWRGIVI